MWKCVVCQNIDSRMEAQYEGSQITIMWRYSLPKPPNNSKENLQGAETQSLFIFLTYFLIRCLLVAM